MPGNLRKSSRLAMREDTSCRIAFLFAIANLIITSSNDCPYTAKDITDASGNTTCTLVQNRSDSCNAQGYIAAFLVLSGLYFCLTRILLGFKCIADHLYESRAFQYAFCICCLAKRRHRTVAPVVPRDPNADAVAAA